MKKQLKKVLAVLLCVLMVSALFGCGAKKKGAVQLFAMIDRLYATREELELPADSTPIGAFESAKADQALIGTWKNADGSYIYTYNADGTATAAAANSDEITTVPYICLVQNGKNILCQELRTTNYDEEGNEVPGEAQLVYSSYLIEGDAMYSLSVEDIGEYSTSYFGTLQRFYRADETGSIEKALKESPIDLTSLYGNWEGDKGNIVIDENGLKLDDAVYAVSLNDKLQLVAEKDGVSTAYNFAVAYSKLSENEDNTEWSRKNALALNYTGADENDKPNLLPCMTDWAGEYNWGEYLYNASFTASDFPS